MKKTVFSAADILLPPYAADDKRWESYGVIACDQFTSEPEYWEEVEKNVGDSLSCYELILPEAYLETEKEEKKKALVAERMKTFAGELALHENCIIYIERTLPDGRVRPGIIGKLDLDSYDFSPDSKSPVRATEETVVSRIPPRVAVRKTADIELPHVMVFANDSEKKLIAPLADKKDKMELVYSFPLMMGGGSISGYKITGELLCDLLCHIAEYEENSENGLVYAMGDGNHSLASAKAHYESIRYENGDGAKNAAHALVEIVDLYDDSIEFEPIYRLLTSCDPVAVLGNIEKKALESEKKQSVVAIVGEKEKKIEIPALHELTVGSLQMLIDEYLSENSAVVCDYIHGEDSLRKLSEREGRVGFLCPGIEKNELFDYVEKNGTLPRKTFSMGEAASKRYYIEARKITN